MREVLKLVQAFDAARKPIAAVCHGPPPSCWLLRGIKGRTCSAYPACAPEVRLSGGHFADIGIDQAHVDGNLVTAPPGPLIRNGWRNLPNCCSSKPDKYKRPERIIGDYRLKAMLALKIAPASVLMAVTKDYRQCCKLSFFGVDGADFRRSGPDAIAACLVIRYDQNNREPRYDKFEITPCCCSRFQPKWRLASLRTRCST